MKNYRSKMKLRGGKKPGIKPFKLWRKKVSKALLKAEDRVLNIKTDKLIAEIVLIVGITREEFIVWQNHTT